MKMKYIKKFADGRRCMDAEGFQVLKEEQTIFCYNQQEPNIGNLEFFCSICNRSVKGLRACESHWTNSKHKKQLHGHESKIKHSKKLRQLSLLEEAQLCKVLMDTTQEKMMSENDYIERRNVCKDFEETIKASGVYDISCHLYGSSVTRVGFCDSNVNIDLSYDIEKISKIIPHITDVPLFLFHIHSTIKNSDKFCDVVDLFHTATPKFTFTHIESGLHCIVCPYYKPGVKTSSLLMDYVSMDPRVRTLCIAFRKWATICGVDDITGGSLSTYCFTIMTIHYLQQVHPPVLPVINLQKPPYLPPGVRISNNEALINTDQIGLWKSNNNSSIAKLWVGLFKYYLMEFFFKTLVVNITQHSPMTKQLRGLNSRRISIEDPFFQKDNVANTLSSSEVMDYFYSCFEKSYRYFSLCATIEKGDKKIEVSPEGGKKSERKKRKEEKRKSTESSDTKKTNSRKEEDELSDGDDVRKDKGQKHSDRERKNRNNESVKPNDVSSKDPKRSDINKLQFPFTNSEDEETNSQSDNKNHQEDFDSHEEDDSEDEESEDEDFVCGDEDLLNDNSDVEIEEEYFENTHGDLEKIDHKGGEIKDNEEHNDVLSNSEGTTNKTNIVTMATDIMNVDPGLMDNECKCIKSDHLYSSSNDESHRIRHSSREYDSQYDGDVDSQAEDDTEAVQSEVQDFVISNEVKETAEMNEKPIETNEKPQTNEETTETIKESENEAPKGSDTLDPVQENVLPNIDKLSIEDHISKSVKEGEQKKIENLTDAVSTATNDDPQINIVTNVTLTAEENVDPCNEAIRQDNPVPVTHDSKHSPDEAHVDKPCDENVKPNNFDDAPEKTPATPTFCFTRKFLAPLRKVPLFCKICSKDGHKRTECDSMVAGKLAPLQPVTKAFFEMWDRLCEKILKDNELTSYEKDQRYRILQEMEKHLKKYLNSSCRLALFGSSVNNFGFRGSDLDICLRFASHDPPVGLDHGSMVVKVSKALDKHPDFHKVMYIKSAKVPIVKFFIGNLNLEGDISLYNCLALNNSRMLKAYASIDTRVRIIGYCAKVFAKVCEMGDASRGSLSSYAYTLLTLYYLQRCEPPVVPILQELYNSQEKPRSMVEGWNTWYFSNIDDLAKVWPGYGKNRQSVGELWLGFLRFYVEKFDFARNVVAMRQIKTLSKFQKGWTHATMCIEDPFNLQHNLAAGISRNMFRYILGCFQTARLHFHTAHPHFRKNCATDFLKQYFFNRTHLTENKHVPKDRLCHRCGRIGHTAANCAEKIVADRERRRLDSERTYSSDNGDSDINQNKGIKCFGCEKYGHRVANCPQKGKSPAKEKQRNGMNRDRKDSDRKGVVSQSEDNNVGIQTAVDFHPMENIGIVLNKSEMTTKIKSENPKRGSKQSKHNTVKDLRMKAEDIEIEKVNSLFANPTPRKLMDPKEQAEGHTFVITSTVDELKGLQASVDGVSFLQSPPGSPKDKPISLLPSPGDSRRRRKSPLKPTKWADKETKKANKNSEEEEPSIFSNQSDFPTLDFSSPKSAKNQKNNRPTNVWGAPPGYQPVSAASHGNTSFVPSADFKFIGQAAAFNRMPSPDNQQTTSLLSADYLVGNDLTTQRNGSIMNENTQGFHFAQPGISRYMPEHGKHMSNQTTSPTKLFQQQKKQDNFTSIHSAFSTSMHWSQAPQPPAGFTHVNYGSTTKGNEHIQGSPHKETNKNTFQFENFASEFFFANSPPKGTKESSSVGSPDKSSDISQTNLPMRYDEEYPPKPTAVTPKKNNKGKNNKGKKGKNLTIYP